MAFNPLCRCGRLFSEHPRVTDDEERQLALDAGLCVEFVEWPQSEMPSPGTNVAVMVGCTCNPAENAEQATLGRPPVMLVDCPVHRWVCHRDEPCQHEDTTGAVESGIYTIHHDRQHYSCEHCTVPQIECEVCGKVWFDWRAKPEDCGWTTYVMKHQSVGPSTTPVILIWRCAACSNE